MGKPCHINVFLTSFQGDMVYSLKEQTGLTVSELTRRMFDYCLQESVLNELVPCMSGRLRNGAGV